MQANQLIDRIETLGLLDPEITAALREQLAQSGARVTPEAVAKLLVDNGQLTAFQATKLIGDLKNDAAAPAGDLASFADDAGSGSGVVEAVPVEPMEAVPVEAVPVEAVAVEAEPVEAVPVSDGGGSGSRRPPSRSSRDLTGSQWDSFKIYGYLFIIAALLLVGGSLYVLLTGESAEEFIGRANTMYSSQNYEGAQEAYKDFLEDYPDDKNASLARTRIVMTELYKAAQFKQQPEVAVDVARDRLPTIAREEGLNEERGNLAQLLVDVAANLTTQADKADETARKRQLLETLAEHEQIMNDGNYMSSTMRTTLGPQLATIAEDKNRVLRDISRNERLDASETAMKEALESKDTKAAYDERLTLIQDFPELHDHQRLQTLISNASDIQQTLVAPADRSPSMVDTRKADAKDPAVVLTARDGRDVRRLGGETFYVRAGGSVMAFSGADGSLLWRRYVGRQRDLPPVRVDGQSGVLLSDSIENQIARCDGRTGDEAWRVSVGEPFLTPAAVRRDLYVTTPAGRLFKHDVESGDVRWGVRIPQSLTAGPGVDRGTARVYQAGDHSNLYVLDGNNGSCVESFYLGHGAGTIAVPPVPLLGHVFVIENATTSESKVHVLKVDESGGSVRVAQDPFRLAGNVRVPPVVQDRQMVVLTDRGQAKVFDVEITAANDQVTEMASLPPFYDTPTSTQMAVDRSAMFITGSRIGRYDLQINTGRIVRQWSLNELDTFIGEPLLIEDTLIHARRLRGTASVRVTAAQPKTGEVLWRTDVGAPVSMIRRVPGQPALHAITVGGALFELDREALQTGSTANPIEDPGAGSVGIRYENPMPLDDDRWVMVDQSGGSKLLLYDPNRPKQKVREVTMNLAGGRPANAAVTADGGVLIPVDTGRVVLINPVTGGDKATPFQPPADPSQKVAWTRPAAMDGDATQVVLADDRGKIYRLRVGDQIRELASADLSVQSKLLGPAGRVGGTYVASTAGASSDILVGYAMMNLSEVFKTPVPGRITWGPVAVETSPPVALVRGDDGMMRTYDQRGELRTEFSIGDGRPVGDVVVRDGKMLIATDGGTVHAIGPTSGESMGTSDIGQPISAEPTILGDRMLVPGKEGVVYSTSLP